jgi:glycosyltransferase involved in cell wall biosynthesis
LNQKPLPHDIIVVHGGKDGALDDCLRESVEGTGVELRYLRMPPSLVLQRNAGLQQAKGDVVFFADDDARYLDGYAEAILQVYRADSERKIGGVQGTITNISSFKFSGLGLAKFFWITRHDGDGTLQPSAWPAFLEVCSSPVEVEVFSGPGMTFRREVLQEFRFDEALTDYWLGDDFDIAYRVSRKYKLIQTPDARALHYLSPLGRDSLRRLHKMMVINHYYLFNKHFGKDWKLRFYWAWSEVGLWLFAAFWFIRGRGGGGFLGMLDGYRELISSARRR